MEREWAEIEQHRRGKHCRKKRTVEWEPIKGNLETAWLKEKIEEATGEQTQSVCGGGIEIRASSSWHDDWCREGSLSGNQCRELAEPETHRSERTHTSTQRSTHISHSQSAARETLRSGSAHNMGLMRHSRNTSALCFTHTCTHLHMQIGTCVSSWRKLSRGSFSFSPLLNSPLHTALRLSLRV